MTSAAEAVRRGSAPLAGLLADATPFLFFTGKGGVGKTSVAAATAVALAEAGSRVLIVSTDPASNLDEVLAVQAGSSPAPVAVPGVPGLAALNIDPEAAAAAYRERVVDPYRGVLPGAAVAQMEEELSGSCTVEIAAFNEFVGLLADPAVAGAYDRVIFDTAPTGHTLRLLTLPGAWTGFLETNTSGITCIGPVSALGQAQHRYGDAVAALRDGEQTTLVLVARPEAAALEEAARTAGELVALGMTRQRLVLNGVFTAGGDGDGDEVAAAWQDRGGEALAGMPAALRSLAAIDTVPLLPVAPVGLDGLRLLLHPEPPSAASAVIAQPSGQDGRRGLSSLVEQIEAAGPGVVMTMGKGGVGKTTVAAAVAVALAVRGHRVILTTTDPAAHVAGALPDPPENLTVTRIDPAAETAAYTAGVLADAGRELDAHGYALLEEDLRSPCTEEVAVFYAFARTVAEASGCYVVIDTAPTGHTLLLLDSSRSFARQVAAQAGALPEAASSLLDTLADPDRTRILLVTLPEATPVHEARKLQADLARAGISPFSWVVNASLAATGTSDPVLRSRAAQEQRWVAEVSDLAHGRLVIVPWAPRPPVGAARLAALTAPAV
ncbi:MAG: arsenical pump-driving ATPase [Candidatus Dormibacteria bacterium]